MANGSLENGSDEDPAIVFDHVCLTYSGGGDESLTDIDFAVKKGETVGIIGGTGSGKTSVVNLIPRFYDATKGTVRINGRDIRDYDIETLRDTIGVVPQRAVLFKGTIRDSEGRLARLLFKLAVEVDMMMNILAAGMEVSESTLKGLRERCVQEVRQTGGNITFLDAVRYQNEV